MLSDRDVEAMPWVPLPAKNNGLKRLKSSTQIIYSSAIAHQIAVTTKQPAALLAVQIADAWIGHLDQPSFWQALPLPSQALPDLHIRATAAGLVQIELSDRAIAAWLETLIQPKGSIRKKQPVSMLPNAAEHLDCFLGQHAHARCCSLLRLANREGLMRLSSPDAHPIDWQFIEPESMPWITCTGLLRFTHPVDRQLICQLFAAWDELVRVQTLSIKAIMGLIEGVAQAFQAFHRAHPIFGPRDCAKFTQTQLGLILATQRILFWLLEARLQVPAPVEL